jgi:hypothetical protein
MASVKLDHAWAVMGYVADSQSACQGKSMKMRPLQRRSCSSLKAKCCSEPLRPLRAEERDL